MNSDPFNLRRFVEAQQGVYEDVLSELRQGHKATHWMWFVFPQIEGLGNSPTARRYAIASLEEARAYLHHPVLGARLRECTGLVNACTGLSLSEIFGFPDDKKFHSCMTLFAHADADSSVFATALRKYCGDQFDPSTVERF